VSPRIIDSAGDFVAPLGWEHIALTGDYYYIWNGSNPSTDFRPLRDVHTAFLPQVA
jgi:hypothetical protein